MGELVRSDSPRGERKSTKKAAMCTPERVHRRSLRRGERGPSVLHEFDDSSPGLLVEMRSIANSTAGLAEHLVDRPPSEALLALLGPGLWVEERLRVEEAVERSRVEPWSPLVRLKLAGGERVRAERKRIDNRVVVDEPVRPGTELLY